MRFLVLAVVACGCSASEATQDDLELAHLAAMRAHVQASRRPAELGRELKSRRTAHAEAAERSFGRAELEMKAELDAAQAVYRDERQRIYLYAVGTRNLLLARGMDTPTRTILQAGTTFARVNTPPGGSKAVIAGFHGLYRDLRFKGLSHDEAMAELCPRVSRPAALPVMESAR